MKPEREYNYYGVFLMPSEKDRLFNEFWSILKNPFLCGWRVLCDHCTLLHHTHRNQNVRKYLDSIIGTPMRIKVKGVGISSKAIAAWVDTPSENAISHITLAVAPGCSPKDSNEIEDWFEFNEDEFPVKFMGVVKKV